MADARHNQQVSFEQILQPLDNRGIVAMKAVAADVEAKAIALERAGQAADLGPALDQGDIAAPFQ